MGYQIGDVDVIDDSKNVVGADGTFSGNVSIAGTLTYQDVTNVDSVGIITAQSGLLIGVAGAGGTFTADGHLAIVGVMTATSFKGDGSQLSGVSAGGITTSSATPSANTTVFLDLASAQHHEVTLTSGITTVSCTGGTVGEAHSVILIQPTSGTTTVGFSTAFLFPSGADPVMSEGNGRIDLISFVVKNAGVAGTELLASAGLNYQ